MTLDPGAQAHLRITFVWIAFVFLHLFVLQLFEKAMPVCFHYGFTASLNIKDFRAEAWRSGRSGSGCRKPEA